ncbi:MAG: hypothetical protein LBP59_13470 [Planctomycetaceae bacterium]|nr:hypothetical protein [Planctomycetaceae bacterium]
MDKWDKRDNFCNKKSSDGSQASRMHFRIAGALGSQTFRLVFLQIRRRNACITGSRASRLHAVVLNR